MQCLREIAGPVVDAAERDLRIRVDPGVDRSGLACLTSYSRSHGRVCAASSVLASGVMSAGLTTRIYVRQELSSKVRYDRVAGRSVRPDRGTVKKTIRKLRTGKGWPQAELAHRAGVAPTSVYNRESGRYEPRASPLRRLAEALGVKMDEIELNVPGKDLTAA